MARTIDPLVSTEWLDAELKKGAPGGAGSAGLVVIDVRFPEEYEAGHIPGAVSVPMGLVSAWAESDDKLLLELPPDESLFKVIGDCGMTADSRVVIVGRLEDAGGPPYPLADAVRVAVTIIYAGVKDVGVLNGAHAKWEREGRPMTTEVPVVKPLAFGGTPNRDMWVSTEYVKEHVGKSVIIDSRDADQYFGASIDPFADMRGHIPTARSLPLVWVWEPDSTYRPVDLIGKMAAGVIGEDKDQEILTYCGVGGYASTWWFLLTRLFGYSNVKIYDGSMEAWVDEGNPLVQYTWTS
jgi:thiosulfate/3-mercaptopyruvate sulfurtransferase